MNESNPLNPGNLVADMDALSASIHRVTGKIQAISQAAQNLNHNRAQLETKIEDAQKRIQNILSRLPEQSDGRQLNLLSEAVPPNNPEDGNEPTTH